MGQRSTSQKTPSIINFLKVDAVILYTFTQFSDLEHVNIIKNIFLFLEKKSMFVEVSMGYVTDYKL